jgi:peptidoglycan/xylan/chitin deacetylase (PgdA/CDA1 family)
VYSIKGKPIVLNKPVALKERFPNNATGGMILSADFELAWAPRFSKRVAAPLKHALNLAAQERRNFPQLISIFDKHKIPCTWATVGHLFLTEAPEDHYKNIKRLPYFETEWLKFTSGDWFDNVPQTNWKEAPEWYAPDLINQILASELNHEIATHTFSHINFSDKICPPEVADDEILYSKMAMESYKLTPESICFPFGSYGNVPILKKHGIKIYRRKLLTHQLAYPFYDDHDLLVTLSSDAFDRSNHTWSAAYYCRRFMKVIDKAIKTGTIAHFVFHPSMDPWMISEVMEDLLKYASKKRDEGKLWIGTMSEIAHHIDGNN